MAMMSAKSLQTWQAPAALSASADCPVVKPITGIPAATPACIGIRSSDRCILPLLSGSHCLIGLKIKAYPIYHFVSSTSIMPFIQSCSKQKNPILPILKVGTHLDPCGRVLDHEGLLRSQPQEPHALQIGVRERLGPGALLAKDHSLMIRGKNTGIKGGGTSHSLSKQDKH